MSFANQQPKDGDIILHCEHVEKNGHWFKIGVCNFKRSDGSCGKTEWVLLCNDCYADYELSDKKPDDMLRLITCDSKWIGNEPGIEVNENRPEEFIEKL
jgi:hypothetical protein